MKAFVIERAGFGRVLAVEDPQPQDDEVIVRVDRVGLCGTDVELFDGTMPYLQQGLAWFPLRPGHEWTGTVDSIGSSVRDVRVGQRVVGDTFVGCGNCAFCNSGRPQLCPLHTEVGVRGGRPGALAEKIALPAAVVYPIPATLSFESAAFVEPGCCSMRGVALAQVARGASTLVWGSGTLGLLAALFAQSLGGIVAVATRSVQSREFVRDLGLTAIAPEDVLNRDYASVIDATGASDVPQRALETVQPGGHLSLLGVPAAVSTLDVATAVLNDITIHGVLGGSDTIPETIAKIDGLQDVISLLIAQQVGLNQVQNALTAGARAPGRPQPKIQVLLDR